MADLATVVGVADSGSEPSPPQIPIPVDGQRDFAMVPLAGIRLHPFNLRRELRNLDELADSIRQNGLVEPVVLVPDPEPAEDGSPRHLLVAGHRRHAACLMAGHDPIEAIIRRDLDSEGAQVLAMLTENGPRDDLTPIEEAHGYQLALGLNQLTPARLARRLGKPRDRVVNRIALARLPDHVQERVHAHQVSLHEAEAMVEFANDAKAIEDLLGAVGRPIFQYQVEQQRQRRATELRIAAVRRQLREAGIRIIERPQDYSWRSIEKPVDSFIDPTAEAGPDDPPAAFSPETHAAACAFHADFVNPYDCRPEHVCTNPAEAGHQSIHRQSDPAPASLPSEGAEVDVAAAEADRLREVEAARQRLAEEAAEAEQSRVQRREALEVASRLRRGFLTTLVRRGGRTHLQAVLRLLLTESLQAWLPEADLDDLRELAELIDARLPAQAEGMSDQQHWDDVVANMRAALESRRSPEAMAGALLAIVGHDREWSLAQGHGWGDAACRRYLDFLVAHGYIPTELEQELLRDLAVAD